jgi:hypothetical protein
VGDDNLVFGENVLMKRECEMARCRDATTSFFAKVRGEVFANSYTFAIKCDSGMGSRLFDMAERIPLMSKEMMSILLNLFFSCLAFLCAGEFVLLLSHTWKLVISLPGYPLHFFQDLHKI